MFLQNKIFFAGNYIIIKINKYVDRTTVNPPNNNNKEFGNERFIVTTKIHYHEVHWNIEFHQPHRVHDLMCDRYRAGYSEQQRVLLLCQHSCNASVIVEHHGVHRKADRCAVQIGSIVGTIHPDNAISVFIPSYNNNKEFGIVVMHRLVVVAIRLSLILMPVPKEHVMLLWQLKLKMQLLLLLLS